MTKPKNATKKELCATDQNAPLRARIRLVFQPGMTITEIARKTQAEVAKVKDAVQKLRRRGEITCDVPHNPPGHALRKEFAGPTITAEMRANFNRSVPEDMAAQIAAFPVKKVTKLPPAGYQSNFPQLLGSKAAWVG
ncbi:hypothetical protein E6C67_08205 [Azospirillum sp. TSA2s]|uniref:hypothetical protein n=1 Tax=Azospirillum sp. TSA2s TaxID=709810 RepID=UPI0010AB0CEB|nr:hypothetical protein [Azospirillum sp. TSA2s]QCG93923.1 hypothetical protein E6C67_08205 [Azospirillum sp. TSA2s]